MKKLKILGLLIVATFVLLGAGCQWFAKPEEEVSEVTTPQVAEEKVEEKATLVIDDGTGSPQTFELEVKEGTTAFDLLKEATDQAGITLDYSESDFGVMIDAMGDKKGGQEDKYWLFYVNGEMAPVAADKQEVKVGDKVEFRFEASAF